MLVVSAVLLGAVLVSIRGISYVPTVEPAYEDPSGLPGPSRYAGQEKIVELRADVSLPVYAFKHLEALNKTFMKQHPNIRVTLHNREKSSVHDDYIQAFRLGNAADVLLMDGEDVLQYAVAARLAPTDDYYASDPETVIMPALVNQLKWNGYIWGIPLQMNPYVLVYHEERWQALVDEDEAADLRELLTSAYQQQQLYAADSLSLAALLSVLHPLWLEELRTEQVQSDDSLAEPSQDEELVTGDAVAASSSSHESGAEHVTASQVEQVDSAEEAVQPLSSVRMEVMWDRLHEGEIAAMIVPLSEYDRHMAPSIHARLLTQADGAPSTLIAGQSFVLSADSPYQEEAFLWIRSISHRYHEDMSLQNTNGYPVIMEAYELGDAVHLQSYPLLMESVQSGSTLLPDPKMPEKLAAVKTVMPSWRSDEQVGELMMRLVASWNNDQLVNEPAQSQ